MSTSASLPTQHLLGEEDGEEYLLPPRSPLSTNAVLHCPQINVQLKGRQKLLLKLTACVIELNMHSLLKYAPIHPIWLRIFVFKSMEEEP